MEKRLARLENPRKYLAIIGFVPINSRLQIVAAPHEPRIMRYNPSGHKTREYQIDEPSKPPIASP